MGHHTARFPFEQFRHLRFGAGRPPCPHCACERVHRWGGFSGRRRYRCTGCDRTFSDFTATPLAHLKLIDRWPGFCSCTLDTLSVRATARRLAVDKNTAFRWRHRLLAALEADDDGILTGTVTLHETWFARSRKGQRRLDRPARTRRAERRHEITPVWVSFAQDETGRVAHGIVGPYRPRANDLEEGLRHRLRSPRELVCPFGPYGAAGILAVRIDVPYRIAAGSDREIVRLWSYIRRLVRWLSRFRGVATRYLSHYLTWHAFLETLRPGPPAGPLLLLAARFP
ncbi:MAG: transposase [Candidatus Longimicrobiales bacterium M2_2A_002]